MKTKFILKAIVLIFILMFTACTKNSETKTYKIGDTGPAGGIVFYDKGNTDGGWRYLEAAPASSEFFAEWGLAFFSLETEMDIGTGKRNTALIVAALNKIRETAGRAARLADDMNINGFNDWFLPSWNELDLMYTNLHKQGLGEFKNDYYWSSSSYYYLSSSSYYEDDALGAYNRFFDGDDTGDGGAVYARNQICRVRAVRSFGGSGESIETGTPAQTPETAQTKTAASSDSYAKFLAGDLSDFAGTWVNGQGVKARITADGVVHHDILAGGIRASDFSKTDGANITYSWWVSQAGDGFGVKLHPAGTEVLDYYNQSIQTDKTKVRITIQSVSRSDEIYYREGEASAQAPQIAYNVTFKDQIIPMTVFYHYNDEGRYYFTKKITFDYNGYNHTLNIPEDWYPYNSIGEDNTYNINVNDFNFDGYMDIAIYNGSGTSTFWYNYFIYDTKGKRYEYNEELSGLPNIFVNEETRTLNLHTNDGHAGLMYTSSDYKWINGKLTLMRRGKQDYDPDRDIYILTSGALNNNGVWEEKKQQFTKAQLSEEFE